MICDRCGAIGRVRVIKWLTADRGRVMLEFCLHHFQLHKETLCSRGWVVAETR